ncbi:hypothetical protein TRIP_C20306 [Candidatus Zixiibacteriota bacterium]|nr:hypothetical protein TRIP_C20306 [candidate division Zixibacteria bacterium]
MESAHTIISIRRKGKTMVVSLEEGGEIILDREIVESCRLKVGGEIGADEFAKIKYQSDYKRAGDYAAYLLAARGYSSGMLKQKMSEKGFDPRAANTVLSELRRSGLVDDRRYAIQTAESLLRRKPAGRKFLVAYLQARHIPHRLAEEAVAKVMENIDEVELAQRLLEKIRNRLGKFELETARAKAYNYLSRRAIGYNAARKAFDIIWKKEPED